MTGHQDRRASGRELAQQVAHLDHTRRVQAVARLVENGHRGGVDQREREPEPLTVAERQVPGPDRQLSAETEPLDHRCQRRRPQSAVGRGDREVVGNGELGIQAWPLDQVPDLGPDALIAPGADPGPRRPPSRTWAAGVRGPS